MRPCWLVVLGLAGCDAILSLDRPDGPLGPDGSTDPNTVQVQTVFEAATPTPATTLTFPVASGVRAGDQLLAFIGSTIENTQLTMSQGWTNLIDDGATNCPVDQWHYWVLRRTAGDESTYTFEFTVQANYTAIVIAYRGAGSANVVDHEAPNQIDSAQNIAFPLTTAALGSRIWIGAIAHEPWSAESTPIGTMPLRSFQNLTVYDFAVPDDGVVPGFDVLIPANLCGALIEAKVEP